MVDQPKDLHVFCLRRVRPGPEEKLAAQGFRSRICVRGTRGHPLSKAKAAANRAKSRIRARIERVFGAQGNGLGGRLVRTIALEIEID